MMSPRLTHLVVGTTEKLILREKIFRNNRTFNDDMFDFYELIYSNENCDETIDPFGIACGWILFDSQL